MGIIVDRNKCNGCGKCQDICPCDLMAVDAETQKAYIREQRDCWDCMCCVKVCPVEALTTKLPYVLADYKATLMPRVLKDSIKWRCEDSKGVVEEFEIKRWEEKQGGG
jgi:adenylylsulfate reductase subunit B